MTSALLMAFSPAYLFYQPKLVNWRVFVHAARQLWTGVIRGNEPDTIQETNETTFTLW
jgi:hypothetical protein